MEQGNIITALALNTDGFSCDFSVLADCECTPCGAGTYGDTVSGGCRSCPVGNEHPDSFILKQTMVIVITTLLTYLDQTTQYKF